MSRFPSRVFVVEEAMNAALTALSFPQFQSKALRVNPDDPDMAGESVEVMIPEPTTIEIVRMGPAGRDENVLVDVVHRLLRPNIKTRSAVRARLAEVSAIVESVTFDTIAQTVTALGFDGEILEGQTTGVRPEIAPSADGWIGVNTVSFRFLAAI